MEARVTREPQSARQAPRRGAHRVPDRRRRLTRRALPLALIALASLLAGGLVGSAHLSPERRMADEFAAAWQEEDFAAMHRLLSGPSRQRTGLAAFETAYTDMLATATARAVSVGRAGDLEGDEVPLAVSVRTRLFGVIRGTVRIPFEGRGAERLINWHPRLTFPDVGPGQRLERHTEMPPRRAILARDGQVLAEDADRSSPIPGVAAQVVGEMGSIPPERRYELRSLGYPDRARVGMSGFERAFDERLAGRPGGTLEISGRVIARATVRPGTSVKTTISPKLQEVTNAALGGVGAAAVLRPQTGEVLALAGVGYTGLSPPGSTFKLITTTAALEEKAVALDDVFQFQTAAVLEGVELENANGESCGGSFENAFAHSCNSVFAPLGAKIGALRLVEEAEEYGFNQPLRRIPGAATSTLPPGDEIGDDLAVGATAIGQGKVLSSALQMASVGATLANRGMRAEPTILFGERPKLTRVTTPAVADTMRGLMVGVVKSGTGTAADLSDVTVAGKTGTAELGTGPGGTNVEGETDAWFVAFAPARGARLAVAVVRFRAGSGGSAAAPVAGQILAEGL